MQFRFGDQLIDTDRRELRRGGALVALEPQVFDVLVYLVQNRDRVVSKDDLLEAVWDGRIVSDSALTSRITAVRKAIGDNGEAQRLIRTAPRKGLRFIGELQEQSEPGSATGTPRTVMVGQVNPGLALPGKPSIAVLPFANMSDDPDQEYFADGIVEEITTALARCPWLFVIARNSSFTFKGRIVDVRQVGRELSVRYLLEGGVRKVGTRVRVTAQLVEGETGNHIWAERYDHDLADIFAVQDNVTRAVAIAVAPGVADAELRRAMRKPTKDLDAWAAYQRGLWYLPKNNPEDNALARQFFERSIEIDPTFTGGYKGLAWAHNQAAGVLRICSPVEAFSSADALARRAIALDPSDAEAHATVAESMIWLRGDFGGAQREAKRAAAMYPNLALAHATLGAALIFSGHPQKGLVALKTARRLDPRSCYTANLITTGLYFSREYEAAAEAAKAVMRLNADYPLSYRWLAAALGQLGRTAEAEQALEKATAIAPASFDMYIRRVRWHMPQDHAHMLEGLRKAGWQGE